MAVSFKNEQSYIKIFKIKENKFDCLYTIKTEEVDLLDFSIDSIYMIYRDISGRSFCYDIKDYKNTKQIESLGLE